MENILKIIQQIEFTSSRTDKENILKQNKDNQLLRDILYFVYNPYILTGISDKKLNKKLGLPTITNPLNDVDDLMTYLRNHNTGTDHNVQVVQDFLNRNRNSELDGLYKQIITKNLKIGITATTINKIFGKGFIPEFNVMLAEKYFDYEDKLNEEFIVTLKLDGNRVVIFNEDSGVKMFTRQGLLYEGLIDIELDVAFLEKGFVYDGELIAVNKSNLNSAELYRETTSKARKDGVKKGLEFHVFDMIPINDFKNGQCKIPCSERKSMLSKQLQDEAILFEYIKEVPILYQGKDKTKVIELLNKVTSEGLEGIMLNLANGSYDCKRSKNILKVKKMQTVDLRIIGYEIGDGKYKNTLGRLNVEYKGNTVGVGSGFTEDERNNLWENRNELIGKIVEIQFFEESSNAKTKEVSLRFPVFKGLRPDKDEESYF